VLDRFNERPVHDQFPNSKLWEREQLITGICSDRCWNEFLRHIFLPADYYERKVWGSIVFLWSETLGKRLFYYSWIVAKIFFEKSDIQYYILSEKFMHLRKNIGIASIGGLLGLRFVPQSIHSLSSCHCSVYSNIKQ